MTDLKSQLKILLTILLMGFAIGQGCTGIATPESTNIPTPTPALASSGDNQESQNLHSTVANEIPPSSTSVMVLSQEVQSLVMKRQSDILKDAGWIHVSELHQQNKEAAGSLPTGQKIPISYVLETWYRINEQGQVLELVSFMKNENNEIVQVSIYGNGLWQNLTVGEKWQGDPPTINLDYGFSNDMAQASILGSAVNRAEDKLSDGKSTLIFTIKDRFDQPVKLEGHEELVVSGETRAQFDPQSGALLSLDRIFIDENGSLYYAEQMQVLTSEKVNIPPEDILDYLEGTAK